MSAFNNQIIHVSHLSIGSDSTVKTIEKLGSLGTHNFLRSLSQHAHLLTSAVSSTRVEDLRDVRPQVLQLLSYPLKLLNCLHWRTLEIAQKL